MRIQFNCRKCGKLLKANREDAGRKAKCSGCGTVLVIPTPRPRTP